jgi:hypothetical protein
MTHLTWLKAQPPLLTVIECQESYKTFNTGSSSVRITFSLPAKVPGTDQGGDVA